MPTQEAPPSRQRILLSAKGLFATKGYERSTTAAIARLAGTSESQLIKHFGNKEGVLEVIFDSAWNEINSTAAEQFKQVQSPLEKLNLLASLVLATMERDPELKALLLLEGRRVRKEGNVIVLTAGYLQFVSILDQVLEDLRCAGQLRGDLNPQAVRSALLGVWEGLMRDQLLGERAGYPARYDSQEAVAVVNAVLGSLLAERVRTS